MAQKECRLWLQVRWIGGPRHWFGVNFLEVLVGHKRVIPPISLAVGDRVMGWCLWPLLWTLGQDAVLRHCLQLHDRYGRCFGKHLNRLKLHLRQQVGQMFSSFASSSVAFSLPSSCYLHVSLSACLSVFVHVSCLCCSLSRSVILSISVCLPICLTGCIYLSYLWLCLFAIFLCLCFCVHAPVYMSVCPRALLPVRLLVTVLRKAINNKSKRGADYLEAGLTV